MPLDTDTLKEINETAHRLEDKFGVVIQLLLPRSEFVQAQHAINQDIDNLNKTVAHERIWAEAEHDKLRLETKNAIDSLSKSFEAFKDEVNGRQIKVRDFVIGIVATFITSGGLMTLLIYVLNMHR